MVKAEGSARSPGEPREPAQSREGAGARPVFASDMALIAEAVEFRQHEPCVELLAKRLVAPGHPSNLHVTNEADKSFQAHGDVAMENLAMIDVELQL